MTDQLADELELPEDTEADAQATEPEQPEPEAEQDEVVVSFGDEEQEQPEEDQPAPAWVKELRKQNRELQKKLKEVEAQTSQKEREVELGAKPTLEACDYDAERFETELLAWNSRKAEADAKAKAKREEQDATQAEWQNRLQSYSEAKQNLRVRDFDEAEDAVREILTVTQQGIVLQAADDPAKLVYALGRNPAKAKELAGVKDPVKFAVAVAKLEMKLTVTPRKPSATPESRVTGTGKTPATAQARLDDLRKQAEASGDYTEYLAAKRKAKGA
jgi:mannitol-1-phosphate/altronate dehydrogenase